MKYLVIFIIIFTASLGFAQEGRLIDYESERQIINEQRYPGAVVLSGINEQVYFNHEGIEVWCNNAVFYRDANFFKAYGNVRMQQGDTVTMTSNYAEYNGTTQFAFASGRVKMTRPQTTLETDSLFFDRVKQQAYYRSGGTVRDTASVLTSIVGRYFMEDDKYSFVSNVVVTNPEYVINSQQLDFYSENGHAYMYGPTTITSETSTVYCERGFYDTRGDTGYFVKNSRIDYENRILEGDSLYFDRSRSFASGTNNIRVTDTLNNSLVTGHYAEVFRDRDSVFITKRAVAATLQEQDSVFIHSDTLMITGKPENRIIRGFYDVRMYKSDMSGKSDSIFVDQQSGLTKLINITRGALTSVDVRRNPVIWSDNNQMTGDTIHLISNPKTEKLDSLKVFDNAFMIQKDTIEGYNQIKGKELTGLFVDNELYQVDVIKNTETIYYTRNSENELIGINKTLSSAIRIMFENKEIDYIDYITQVDGTLTPEPDFPENARILRGFNWRGDEQLHSKEDLFAGKPPPQLVPIRGIPLPEIPDDFFDEEDEDSPLLNENSRLKPQDLRDKKIDTIAPVEQVQDTLALRPVQNMLEDEKEELKELLELEEKEETREQQEKEDKEGEGSN
ncbi:OstA-like protein [Antarcticibacterium flavum]|uniref:OstA-like protein n=1 Tax=Antarcticibacterium flavum TaxID=2058175 RepID=A0A5B7X9T3_9FLAO|nr:OstA-like protein [Antarcticibacterium sp. W02-3]QCY71478.1 OstA-like protein [Antarcticibacterium flavum]